MLVRIIIIFLHKGNRLWPENHDGRNAIYGKQINTSLSSTGHALPNSCQNGRARINEWLQTSLTVSVCLESNKRLRVTNNQTVSANKPFFFFTCCVYKVLSCLWFGKLKQFGKQLGHDHRSCTGPAGAVDRHQRCMFVLRLRSPAWEGLFPDFHRV